MIIIFRVLSKVRYIGDLSATMILYSSRMGMIGPGEAYDYLIMFRMPSKLATPADHGILRLIRATLIGSKLNRRRGAVSIWQ